MRIAIITQPIRTSYGGILQNYALQTVLKRRGHTVCTLQKSWQMKPQFPGFFMVLLKRFVKKCMGKNRHPLFYEPYYNRDFPIFTKYTRGEFAKKYLVLREVSNLDKDVASCDYDAYVVGSDQVWRPSYNNIYHSFLSFTRDWKVKRVAYAASFGVDSWEFSPKEEGVCKQLAQNFDAISVREITGKQLCEKYLQQPALHVLDPTMLLTQEDYNLLIDNYCTHPSEGNLFFHVLDKTGDFTQLLSSIASDLRLTPFAVNQEEHEDDVEKPIEKRIQPPIEQWLRSFKDAEFVVTDSFHATVFSILFNKQFVVYANKGRGVARLQSLLSMFGIENRVVSNHKDWDLLREKNIDYSLVNEKIEKWRSESNNFINNIF